ncbi:hypothetical protein EDD29_0540 [Actinocorallia herbida]|uniref:Uncharacterized protein n=1 Tax=Actinocorallia herbida TaxID=58109 RepID=A0A3N1CP12_9ACTN|nr:hypothetical protein [Actinocorallia herbida]ROO83051.1 hypothetical protein EDD29_0540 [Actinocorallia herbida]
MNGRAFTAIGTAATAGGFFLALMNGATWPEALLTTITVATPFICIPLAARRDDNDQGGAPPPP